jgi:hypothetical protein
MATYSQFAQFSAIQEKSELVPEEYEQLQNFIVSEMRHGKNIIVLN